MAFTVFGKMLQRIGVECRAEAKLLITPVFNHIFGYLIVGKGSLRRPRCHPALLVGKSTACRGKIQMLSEMRKEPG